MGAVLQSITITLPASDIPHMKAIVSKMGWTYEDDSMTSSEKGEDITTKLEASADDGTYIRPEVRQLMGIAAGLNKSLISSDPRLSYLLSR